jgi:hypothetical protein
MAVSLSRCRTRRRWRAAGRSRTWWRRMTVSRSRCWMYEDGGEWQDVAGERVEEEEDGGVAVPLQDEEAVEDAVIAELIMGWYGWG